jgi:hypothetical protein
MFPFPVCCPTLRRGRTSCLTLANTTRQPVHSYLYQFSVLDPDQHGSELLALMDLDPDPEEINLTKNELFKILILSPNLFENALVSTVYGTYVYFWLIAYIKYLLASNFNVKLKRILNKREEQ